MLELIQLSVACRGSQYRDIVPVCGGSAERVADTNRNRKEGGDESGEKGYALKEELADLTSEINNEISVTMYAYRSLEVGLFDFQIFVRCIFLREERDNACLLPRTNRYASFLGATIDISSYAFRYSKNR